MSTTRLKYVAEVVAGQSPGSEDVGDLLDGMPFIQGNAEFGRVHPRPKLECSLAPKIAKKGDLLLSVRAPVGALNTADQDYGIGRGLNAIRARLVDARYLYWLLNDSKSYLDSISTGSTFAAVTAANVGSISVPLTDLPEQEKIADYLDVQTAKIDALIGKQEQLIETLAERRQAVISLAVTKGIDPNAPMKDSGSLWFPTIPDHWELVPCSAAAVLIQTGPFGSQLHSDEYISGGTPVINPSHIVDGRIVPDDAITVNDVRGQELARHRLRDGDIVAARRGDLGRSAVVRGKSVGYLCGTGALIIRLKPEAYVPGYFQLIFSSGANRAALTERSVGATMDNLNADIVSRLRLPRPPVDEQSGILDHLDPATSKIDALSAKAREMIEVLRERRQALVSAAVTGKIDVRGLT